MKQVEVFYGKKSMTSENKIFVKEEDFQILAGEESFGIPLYELQKIQRRKINGKTISELFSFDDCSIWWFLHPTIYPELKKLTNFITKFLEFIDQHKPIKITINGEFKNFDIIKQICEKEKILFSYSKKSYLEYSLLQKIKRKIQQKRYEKIFAQKNKKRKTIFSSQKNSLPTIKDKVVFVIPTIYHRDLIDYKTGKSFKGEYIQQSIIEQFEESVVGIDVDYTFNGDYKVLEDRISSKISWMPVESIINNEENSQISSFIEKYKKIIKNPKFQNLFKFKEIFLWTSMEEVFEKFNYAPYIPNYLQFLDSVTKFLEENKPKIIFLSYETGPFGQAIIIASKKNQIKTVAVAHGAIDKNNPMYAYDRLRINGDKYGFPIPETTLVHGEFSKQTMVNQGYPSERIVVYGNPAFFKLEEIRKLLNQKNLHEKYGIDKNQQVILYPTEFLQEFYSAQGKYNYNSLILKKLLENFVNKEQFMIILKPHPNENTSVYEKILKQFSSKNVKIIQGNLFELIHISSVVVSVFSNVMTDALCFEKPVIRVTFDNIQHTVPYEEFEVVLSTNLENLIPNIFDLLNNKQLRAKLKKNLQKFLKEQNNIPVQNPELIIENLLTN